MLDFKKVSGGILLQTTDDIEDEFKNLKVVTKNILRILYWKTLNLPGIYVNTLNQMLLFLLRISLLLPLGRGK